MSVALIVAVADNGVIGHNNALPWHLPDDLKHFRRVTLGKPVVMGRKTFESIGHPLPGRPNIVLTRDPAWRAEGVTVAHTLIQGLQEARHTVPPGSEIPEIMVIGGADLFAAALPLADRLYLTEVHQSPPGDVYFPPFDRDQWTEVSRTPGLAGSHSHEFVVLERHS